jgi:hypothetical protein
MHLGSDNNITNIFDKHYALQCPHCNAKANITAISFPKYELVKRFSLKEIGIVYRCDACNKPIFLKFDIPPQSKDNNPFQISDTYYEIERHRENFELNYLPDIVKDDFKEALDCYSNQCFNAFASMCRRTIQSAADELGAKGKDKVQHQLNELKELAGIDDETYEILKQIIITGHDGTHPHLPKLSKERAQVLLELIKDVLYQFFVRKAKIQESVELRKEQIENNKKEK